MAYPTEAVYGLGCDPENEHAVMQLLKLKHRPVEKGLILIASQFEQIEKYLHTDAISAERWQQIFATWPGPNTWLIPKSKVAKDFLTGGSDLIAVRISGHNSVIELCDFLQSALVSTSANLSGQPPAKSEQQVFQQFGDTVLCIKGTLGGAANPSIIRNSLTGEVVRAG